MSIRDEIHFGIKWSSGALFLTRAAGFVTSIVLARLLAPDMFGLVAMANVAIATIGVIRELGFGAAYIQRQTKNVEEERVLANTTFLVGFILNLALFLACSTLTPAIANFFKAGVLESVLKILFGVFLFDAISTVPSLILQKRLEFGKLALCEIVHSFSNALIAIPLALLDFGVWSLVYGQLGSKLIYLIMSFKLSNWHPRIEFSMPMAKEQFAYGKFMWAFVVLSAIGDAIDKVMIGKVLGAASLGYYGLAFSLANLPAANISSLVNQITFPAFSKVQGDHARLKNAFIKTLSHVSIISMPVAFGILAVAENLVVVVCGRKWLPAVPLIKILVFYGMSLSISSLAGPIFKAMGKPNVMLYTSILHHLIKISLLFLLIGYGAVGICYAVVIPLFVSSLIAFALVANYLKLTTTELVRPIAASVVCSVAMFWAIKIFEASIKANAALPLNTLLLSSITFGIGAYLVAAFFISRSLLVEFKNTLTAVIRSKGKLV